MVFFPVVLLSLGYPTKYPEPRRKLGTQAIVHEEVYQDLPIEENLRLHGEKYEGKTFPLTEGKLSTIYKVASDVGGKDYADELIKKTKEQGHINMAQRYFALHYSANWACSGNQAFIDTLVAYGFDWIKGI